MRGQEYLPRLWGPRPFAKGRGGGAAGRVRCVRACVMSSYVMYCRAQAAECARRAKLASSPELATERRNLGLRWLRLAEKAKATPLNRVREPAPKA
jgi:hypothetical protein